ncbi:MAG: PKD domain-containing protein, partial [Candidatus Absconditabacterales bacterium]
MNKKIFSKIIINLLIISIFCVANFLTNNNAGADYQKFLEQLNGINISAGILEKQKSISRYDVAKLLNAVECNDCIVPNKETTIKYSNDFRNNFIKLPGKNFNDISYKGGIFNEQSYYYCVASVANNSYMRGYPKETSPICAGLFCGDKNITKSEFIEVIINIISKYTYKEIYVNRNQIKNWMDGIKSNSQEAKNLNDYDKQVINQNTKNCKQKTCNFTNPDEIKTYLKYCMFNLSDCNMSAIGKIKQGFWPVAELNFLYIQNIIDIQKSDWTDIYSLVNGKIFLETLGKLNQKINCSFNNDYDCDGIENIKDNCPNDYNPNQNDTNKNGIGDVCGDDIDGDGIKNPIGIVDDEGRINIKLRTTKTDNCLFIKNLDQTDINKNGIGDICENENNMLGLYINVEKINGSAPITVNFDAITKGTTKEINWDFGDGEYGIGQKTSHTYIDPGFYIVKANAKGTNNDANAQITLIVGGNIDEQKAIQIKTDKIGGNIPLEISLSASTIGKVDELIRNIGDTKITTKPNQSFKKIFNENGKYIATVKSMQNGEIVAVSQFLIGIGPNNEGAILKTNMLNPDLNQTINFKTQIYGIKNNEISSIKRDFGDGEKTENNNLEINHIYKKAGKKVLIQTINLINGSNITNLLTLYIVDKRLLNSYTTLLIPGNIYGNIGEKINFTVTTIGDIIKNPKTDILQYEESITAKKDGNIKFPFQSSHTYTKNGIYYPQNTLYTDNQCTYFNSQATIIINGTDLCLDAKLNGSLNNKFKCDIDKDGIADICDDDIDGDGVKNLIGLIDHENKDCSIQTNNSDFNKNNLDLNLLKKHFQGICSLDNAPFDGNKEQTDLDSNGIGDINNNILNENTDEIILNKDSDGDGISDIQDECKNNKETYNGISDEDGCPEIGLDLLCNNKYICGNNIIQPGETCDSCPEDVGPCGNNNGNNSQNNSGIENENGNQIKNICGNGLIENGELCDDGNLNNRDGCNNFCSYIPQCPINTKLCSDNLCHQICGKDDGFGSGTNGNGSKDLNCNNNGICSDNESCSCSDCLGQQNHCQDGLFCSKNSDGFGVCLPTCGNGKIDDNENCLTCATDVGLCSSVCGNSKKEEGENCQNCSADFGTCKNNQKCGDGNKDYNEDCLSCHEDFGLCSINGKCGDGEINEGENCQTCAQDVKKCTSFCGNGILNDGELCDDGNLNNRDGCNNSCSYIPQCPINTKLCSDNLCHQICGKDDGFGSGTNGNG